MPWGVAAGAAAAIGSGALGYLGAQKQADVTQNSIDLTNRMYQDQVAREQPYLDFGKTQLNSLSDFLKQNNPVSNYIDPGYQFRKTQAMNSLTGNAATSGMLQSGDTLRAATDLNQNMASQEYSNAFSRWLSELQARQNLAGMGQNAAANLGYTGQAAAQNVGNLTSSGALALPYASAANSLGSIGGAGMNYFARQGNNPAPTNPAGSNNVGALMADNPESVGWV